jgi:putative SOS response-associated peptidase YedK
LKVWAYSKKLDTTSSTIVAAGAGVPMRQIHGRKPVILDPTVYDAWLDPETPAAEAKSLVWRAISMAGCSSTASAARSTVRKNQGGECIEPINPL